MALTDFVPNQYAGIFSIGGLAKLLKTIRDEVETRVAALESSWKTAVKASATANLAGARVGNVLTASANGALAAQDGVTMAVGDRLLVPFQSTAANSGVYIVTSLGGAGSKWVLTRDTSTFADETVVRVAQGTLYADSEWFMDVNGTYTVNTTDPAWTQWRGLSTTAATALAAAAAAGSATTVSRSDHAHPKNTQTGTLTLIAGTKTINTVIVMTANSVVLLQPTESGGTAGTRYKVTGKTAGVAGVGAFTVTAIDTAGSLVNTDTSTFDFVIVD